MTRTATKISLADLTAAGLCLLPSETVAIVRAVLEQVMRDDLPGVPSAHVIRLTAAGDISIEGPVASGGPQVRRAAHLLEAVLAAQDLPPDTPVPGALRFVIARGLGTIDLPRYATLDAFTRALQRFASPDVTSCVADLCAAYASARRFESFDACRFAVSLPCGFTRKDEPLTIADIRRARRSTRLSLDEVSERSRIPAWMIQELEWGDFRHWPGGVYGRTQLKRYARGAGLDETLVVKTVWPLIENAIRTREAPPVVVDDQPPQPGAEAIDEADQPFPSGQQRGSQPRSRRRLATVAALLLIVGVALAPEAHDWFTEPHTAAPASQSTAPQPPATSNTDKAPRRGIDSRPAQRSSPSAVRARRSSTASGRSARRKPVLQLRITLVGDSSFRWPH